MSEQQWEPSVDISFVLFGFPKMKGEETGRKICKLCLGTSPVQDKLEAVVEAVRAVVRAGAVPEGAGPGGMTL